LTQANYPSQFEELKKKNKKKKNKKKTEAVDEGKDADEIEISDKIDQLAVEDTEAEETHQSQSEETIEAPEQVKVEKEELTEAPEEVTEAVEGTVEDAPKKQDFVNESEAVKEDEPMEKANEKQETVEGEVQQEEPAKDKIIEESDVGEEPSPVEEPVKVEESEVDERAEETNQCAPDVPDLFENSGPSFMESIQLAKLDDELTQLKEHNQKLTSENSSLEQQLEDLKKENKSLKLVKMDHLDQIETLQEKIRDLESKLSRAKVDSSAAQSAYDQDDNLSLSPSPPYQRPQIATSFSQFDLNKNDSSLSLAELKARFNKWKGWNIDMSSWRSIGTGPVVEL
jgi:chromosome segregation ATPase